MDRYRKILCVHQGYELYGSDRSFVQCVQILKNRYPAANIRILLPKDGPIVPVLEECGVQIDVEGLWILRKKSFLYDVTLGFPKLIRSILRARKNIRDSDLVYINTAVVADYLIAARGFPAKVVAHIREIPTGLARLLVRPLVLLSKAALIFNSEATRESFAVPASVKQRVIYNAVKEPVDAKPLQPSADGILNIVMLGRINAWKGQDLLVEAVGSLPAEVIKKLRVRIIGGVFEAQNFEEKLREQIDNLGLTGSVTIEEFASDTRAVFEWCHLAVVPSRLPEPFGRVAIEAMAYGRPVVAARHGGLTEIVKDQETGFFFEPNDAKQLGVILQDLAQSFDVIERMGARAKGDFRERFNDMNMAKSLIEFVDEVG